MVSLFMLCFSGRKKIDFPASVSKTVLAQLKEKDSLCYYQCYCALTNKSPEYLNTDSALKYSAKKGLVTVTEKFVLNKTGEEYRIRYFVSALFDYPNKKFAYLKLIEKPYWNFKLVKDTLLDKESVLRLAALELKLRPLTEYNFKVENNNYPQVILNGKRVSEQRMVEGNYILQSILKELK